MVEEKKQSKGIKISLIAEKHKSDSMLLLLALLVGLYVGGLFELKVKTKGGLNLTYTDKMGLVKNVF